MVNYIHLILKKYFLWAGFKLMVFFSGFYYLCRDTSSIVGCPAFLKKIFFLPLWQICKIIFVLVFGILQLHHDILKYRFIFMSFFFWWRPFFKNLYWICYSIIAFILCFGFLWDLAFPTRDLTCSLCIGRQSLNHWTAREVPRFLFIYAVVDLVSFLNLWFSVFH